MEIWKDVKNYEGLYQVSNLGNVKRISSFKGVNKQYLNDYYSSKKAGGGMNGRLQDCGLPLKKLKQLWVNVFKHSERKF